MTPPAANRNAHGRDAQPPSGDAAALHREAGDKRALYARTAVGLIISVVRALFLARLLAPAEMSAYRLGTSWVPYFGVVTLGAIEAFAYRAPGLRAAGMNEEAGRYQAVALVMALLTASVAAAGTTALFVFFDLASPPAAIAFGGYAFVASMTPYFNAGLWVAGHFRRQARTDLVTAVAGAVLGLGGLWLFGFTGLIAGSFLGQGLSLWLVRDLLIGVRATAAERTDYAVSISFGVKQTALLFLQSLLTTADLQVLAIVLADTRELGVYAFATMLVLAIRTAATAGAIVNQVELLSAGARDDAGAPWLAEADRHARLDNIMVSLASLVALAAVVALAPLAFPAYFAVVEPLAALSLSATTFRWGYFHSVAVSMRALQWRIVPLAIAGTLLNCLWAWAAVWLGAPLAVVALAPGVGCLVYSVCTVLFCERLAGKPATRSTVWHILMTVGAQLPVVCVRAASPWQANLGWVALALLLYLLTTACLARKDLDDTLRLILTMCRPDRMRGRQKSLPTRRKEGGA
ncbi:MAG: hypothetical protein ACE148_12790 [Vicinamibacterales bacterium]